MIDDTDDRVFLTFEEAIALLPNKDTIHTFISPAINVLIGADWSREDILAGLRNGKPQLTGDHATRLGHGLAFQRGEEYVFVETRKETP